MRSIRRKSGVLAIAASLVIVGLVYAAWTTNGSGDGYAKAGSSSPLTTVDVSASTAATLYPGGTGDVYVKISNPNPYAVTVTGITGNGAITADSGHSGCTTTGVTFTDQSSLSVSVPASGSTLKVLTGAAAMSNASVNACQGAVFTVPVTLTGASG